MSDRMSDRESDDDSEDESIIDDRFHNNRVTFLEPEEFAAEQARLSAFNEHAQQQRQAERAQDSDSDSDREATRQTHRSASVRLQSLITAPAAAPAEQTVFDNMCQQLVRLGAELELMGYATDPDGEQSNLCTARKLMLCVQMIKTDAHKKYAELYLEAQIYKGLHDNTLVDAETDSWDAIQTQHDRFVDDLPESCADEVPDEVNLFRDEIATDQRDVDHITNLHQLDELIRIQNRRPAISAAHQTCIQFQQDLAYCNVVNPVFNKKFRRALRRYNQLESVRNRAKFHLQLELLVEQVIDSPEYNHFVALIKRETLSITAVVNNPKPTFSTARDPELTTARTQYDELARMVEVVQDSEQRQRNETLELQAIRSLDSWNDEHLDLFIENERINQWIDSNNVMDDFVYLEDLFESAEAKYKLEEGPDYAHPSAPLRLLSRQRYEIEKWIPDSFDASMTFNELLQATVRVSSIIKIVDRIRLQHTQNHIVAGETRSILNDMLYKYIRIQSCKQLSQGEIAYLRTIYIETTGLTTLPRTIDSDVNRIVMLIEAVPDTIELSNAYVVYYNTTLELQNESSIVDPDAHAHRRPDEQPTQTKKALVSLFRENQQTSTKQEKRAAVVAYLKFRSDKTSTTRRRREDALLKIVNQPIEIKVAKQAAIDAYHLCNEQHGDAVLETGLNPSLHKCISTWCNQMWMDIKDDPMKVTFDDFTYDTVEQTDYNLLLAFEQMRRNHTSRIRSASFLQTDAESRFDDLTI